MKFTGGLPETACGLGSTLAHTERLRLDLSYLLRRIDCRTLLDAPCGDLNWMSQVDLAGIDYIGVDASEENLKVARPRRMHARSSRLEVVDIVAGSLPGADTVLCRDFLQHLPIAMVWRVLSNIKCTGADWLIVTSHDVPVNDLTFDEVGGFRPLNMKIDPFNMPAVERLDDGGRDLLVVRLT